MKARLTKLEAKAVTATQQKNMLIVLVPNDAPEIVGYSYQGNDYYPEQGQSLDTLKSELIKQYCTPERPLIIVAAITKN